MKKTLRAGALAVALATTSVTVPVALAPAALAAEQPASGAGAAKQAAPQTLDEQIAAAEADLERFKAIHEGAKVQVEALQAAIAGDGKPTAAQQKALDDAKAAFAAQETLYKAAKKKRDDAKTAATAAQTKADEAAKALEDAEAAVATAQAKLTDLQTKRASKDIPDDKKPSDADIIAAEAELTKAKDAVPGKVKADENAKSALSSAQTSELLAGVELDKVEKPYNEAELALKRAKSQIEANKSGSKNAEAALPTAQLLLTQAEAAVTNTQTKLDNLKAQKAAQAKAPSLPQSSNPDGSLTPVGIAGIVVGVLAAILALGAALLPNLQQLLPR